MQAIIKKRKDKLTTIIRYFIFVFVGVFALGEDPFGLASSSQMAFQNAYINLTAPFYKESAQNDIVMVSVDEESMAYLHDKGVTRANNWPLVYKDHASILKYLLEAQPRAIFMDVYFKEERATDETFNHLQGVIKRANSKAIPLLFAQGYEHEQLTPMQLKLDAYGGLAVNGWQNYETHYALKLDNEESIAYRLYRIACLEDQPFDSCSANTLQPQDVAAGTSFAVQWADRAADVPFPQYSELACDKPARQAYQVPDALDRVVDIVIKTMGIVTRGFFNDPNNTHSPCLYHQTLPVEQLVDVVKAININEACWGEAKSDAVVTQQYQDAKRLCHLLKDKIVIYTVNIEAATDKFDSPVHGSVPGAYRHAMALDNLIVEGSRITYKLDDYINSVNHIVWAVLVALFMRIESVWPKHQDPTKRQFWKRRMLFWGVGFALVFAVGAYFHYLGQPRYEPQNLLTYVAMVLMLTEFLKGEFGIKIMALGKAVWEFFVRIFGSKKVEVYEDGI